MKRLESSDNDVDPVQNRNCGETRRERQWKAEFAGLGGWRRALAKG